MCTVNGTRKLSKQPRLITITSASDGEFLEVNEGFEQISGYTRDDIIGKGTLEIGIWRDASRRKELIEELHTKGSIREFAFDIVTKNGEVRSCVVSAELLEIAGKQCILAVTRDVTQQMEYEERLRELSETLKREQVDCAQERRPNEVLQHIERKLDTGMRSRRASTICWADAAQAARRGRRSPRGGFCSAA
jgi:PAS domain S-box-containing protein